MSRHSVVLFDVALPVINWRERLMLLSHKLLVVAAFSLLSACATIEGEKNDFDAIAEKTNAWQTNYFEINLPLNFLITHDLQPASASGMAWVA